MKKPTTTRTITLSEGWSIPTENGVGRRTLVKGAAWAVPAVAVTTATPAAAASGSPTLAFTRSSYSGTACGTITGVQVKRTTDGTTADPGRSVTVKLADGYTFADGKTSYTGTTGSDGLITLPDISVPARGGKSTFAATSDSLSASAPVSADPSADSGLYVYDAGSGQTSGPVKNSADAIKVVAVSTSADLVFQNSNGTIYGDDGTAQKGTDSGVDTKVDRVSIRTNSNAEVWFKKSDGLYKYDAGSGAVSGPVKDSAKAIKVISTSGRGSLVFQNSDGSIHGDNGAVQTGTEKGVDTGADLVSIRTVDGQDQVWYKKSDGLYVYNAGTGKTSEKPVANSADAIKIISRSGSAALVFQNSDGSIHGDNGAVQTGTEKGVDTGADLVSIRTVDGQDQVWYKKSDGLYVYNAGTGKTSEKPVKDSADAIRIVSSPGSAGLVFQNSDGSIHGDNGSAQPGTASGVETGADLVAIRLINGAHQVWYKKSPPCK
ncbi:hypothetical protein [Rathayibacter tritici]|uniref:Uncharacterized protein n=1 Tax=Rathayibacter tritici TaxID=33888 RepID=A0A160KU31_9MICO|nr:hypothetical protein [Rathayibacter tritici]AND17346.1 hypothetical protein A6122_2223 [Rathayibacter tritici]PPI41243.1 hypothetical protein C5D18_14640 [Rathayibacter tritici]